MSETIESSRIDEEDIRLTTGFADIFTAILLVFGGSLLLGLLHEVGGAAIAASAFLLGKPLVENREFAASGSVLAVGVAVGTGIALSGLGVWSLPPIALASFAFWKVRRVPLAMALAFAALVAYAVWGAFTLRESSAFGWNELASSGATVPALVGGLLLFAVAMWFDSRDRLRRTRLADVAFWLHLMAAPFIVHGVIALSGSNPFVDETVDPATVIAIFASLTLVSVIVDRRPLLASSFVYLVFAVGTLISESSRLDSLGPSQLNAATAPAIIGIVILALAAGWTALRRAVVSPLPEALRELLPPVSVKSPPPHDRRAELPDAETEPVRLVLGFNDFFVALGVAGLFVGSVVAGMLASSAYLDALPNPAQGGLRVSTGWILVLPPAAAMWLVAEYFVRKRRMAWPAIVSALCFAMTLVGAGIVAASHLVFEGGVIGPGGRIPSSEPISERAGTMAVLLACAVGLGGNLAFWWRHRLPISFALAISALLPLAFIDVLAPVWARQSSPFAAETWTMRLALFGLATFAIAMLWDRSDPKRETQRADIAFWLHLLAALLVVPALAFYVRDLESGPLLVLAGFAVLLLLALAIDRRAPLVVALPFVIGAIGRVMPAGLSIVSSLVVVGLLLALAYNWERVRTALRGFDSA